MSDRGMAIQNDSYIYRQGTRWGAIWAGVFTFAAVWSVFEILGVAIFPTTNGMGVGLQIWTVILTIVAMYVAGLETGRLAGVANRHDGLIHGMIMFGLSAVSAVILTGLAAGVMTNPNATHTVYISTGTQWGYFCAFFFGWLAAMGGASTGVARRAVERTTVAREPIQMRPAA
jgi:hypothetical protein